MMSLNPAEDLVGSEHSCLEDRIRDRGKSFVGVKCFESMIDRLMRVGRTTQVIGFLERMERDYGLGETRKYLCL
ncbi:hypothetical protein DKX38_022123 [Salix brachista]|uniref:Pentatricopeptide repeat-containing protein n=1 Tax=Salix brachista TaxID=2182728 RepID=A0A5N5K232_9ROSI|nr:hypothetical protein DKX38_022123 [Salix brachista]